MAMALNWGICSAGLIAHDFTACLRSLSPQEHRVVAVATRKLESAQEFADTHNIPKAYGSYEELAKDPDVSVVYISSINPYHLPLGKLMLNHGKHVLIEKPLGMNLREVKELTTLARQKGLFLMEALWSRFLPSYDHLMKEIRSGSVGEILYAHATFGRAIAADRLVKKDLGGGTLLDLGIYCTNALTMVFEGATPTKIAAVGHLGPDGVDECVAASLQYPNGKLGMFNTSCKADFPSEITIVGTKGSIKVCDPMWCASRMNVGDKLFHFPLPDTVVPCNFMNSSGLRYEAMEVRRCILAGLLESERMSHKDSEQLATILDECRRQVGTVYSQDSP